MKSEFGFGTTYCLGLFLAHERAIDESVKSYTQSGMKDIVYSMWFYGACDHLYDLQIPEVFPKHLRSRLMRFKTKCFNFRLPTKEENEATKEDFIWAIDEAKTLLRLIDKNMFEIDTIKGEWQ